jgi:AcrR family transcriptional regulator
MRREPLSREQVVAAAMAIADEHGVELLTMRRLGTALGVEAMSLYNHVANKADLIAAMLDTVVGEYRLPSPQDEWKATLRTAAASANEALLRHPWAPTLLLSFGVMPGPNWMQWSESVLATAREAGFSVEMAHHAFHALEGHIGGQSMRQVNFRPAPGELEGLAADFLSGVDTEQYPFLIEHIQGHLQNDYSATTSFEFGLDLILEGLERILKKQ